MVFDLSIDGHVASATKDRSGLFDGQYFTPGIETGTKLLEWLHSGRAESEMVSAKKPEGDDAGHAAAGDNMNPAPGGLGPSERKNGFLLDHLDQMLNKLDLGRYAEAYHAYVCERYGVGGLEELESKQLAEQLNLPRQCTAREEKLAQFIEILEQHKLAA